MTLQLGPRKFSDSELVLMAVINRTPDSFYDGGATYRLDDASTAVSRAVAEGADIVDVGGVKAAPGVDISPGEEMRRVLPLISLIHRRHPRLVISIDTWRAEVARAALAAGAHVINDAWGGFDPEVAEVAADQRAGLICTHTGGIVPRTVVRRPRYSDVVSDVRAVLTNLAERAIQLGVARESIVVDPGHDFAKNTRHSLEVTRRLDELVSDSLPVLVSVSNKDFIGESLDLPVSERIEGTMATLTVCAWLGARVFRVHNVQQSRRTLDMVATIMGRRPPTVARRALA
ncbi:MAG: dihydropteroate synthase [Pseudonocardiaceae bacterium]